jgi:hypothetical protein
MVRIHYSTRYIDENGNEITKEKFQVHDYAYKVWTKEKFKTKWSKVLTKKETKDLKIDHYPIYTAIQIQLVQMTDEEYIARDYSQKKGHYSLQIYFGEAFDNQEMNVKLQQEIWEHIDMSNSKINSVSFQKLANDRKEKLLEIEEYPIFILYDHEKLLLKTDNLDELVNFLNPESESTLSDINSKQEEPVSAPASTEQLTKVSYYPRKDSVEKQRELLVNGKELEYSLVCGEFLGEYCFYLPKKYNITPIRF